MVLARSLVSFCNIVNTTACGRLFYRYDDPDAGPIQSRRGGKTGGIRPSPPMLQRSLLDGRRFLPDAGWEIYVWIGKRPTVRKLSVNVQVRCLLSEMTS
jgi:hypothetical protein